MRLHRNRTYYQAHYGKAAIGQLATLTKSALKCRLCVIRIMAERFANVVYWMSCCAALIAAASLTFAEKQYISALIAAGLIWLSGKAIRYILIGR